MTNLEEGCSSGAGKGGKIEGVRRQVRRPMWKEREWSGHLK